MTERLVLFDTTLRDGQQTPGIDFSVEDKIAVAAMLDELGVDYVEGGYPGANPTDTTFFECPRTKSATFTAFGMTARAGRSAANDPGVAALLNSAASAVCFVAKAWDYHVRLALGITPEENLASIRSSIEAARAAGKEALLDAEHFFDGYKADPTHALGVVQAAHGAGASWIVLCDTNGGTLPHEIERIVGEVRTAVPDARLGIHAHDDTGHAVANSLAAVRAGCRHVQGTLNGIGERCGNADLVALIPTLMLKEPYASRFEVGVSETALRDLTRLSHAFDELLNRQPEPQRPYVGSSAFATKAGIHASALLKEPETYEHIAPDLVGNERRVMVSDQAGRSNFLDALKRCGIEVPKDHPRLDVLIETLKRREAEGYAFEAAEASFELLAREVLGTVPRFFEVEGFRCLVERRRNAVGDWVTVSEATIKLTVDGEEIMSVAEGDGPVNALDRALRKDFGALAPRIADLELTDYKVRIIGAGTDAVTRVLIESTDETGARWWTVGVSENIIDASFRALLDSIRYKLVRGNASPYAPPIPLDAPSTRPRAGTGNVRHSATA